MRTEVISKDYTEIVSKTRTEVKGKTRTEVVSREDRLQGNSNTDMQVNSQKDIQVISTRRWISVALLVVVGEPAPSSQAEASMAPPAVSTAMDLQLVVL